MARIYDGAAIAAGSKMPSGEWGWSDFGWHTSLPATIAKLAPETELAKARQNPQFAEWIGGRTGDSGSRQAASVASNTAESARRAEQMTANSPRVMNHGGRIRVGLCEDGE